MQTTDIEQEIRTFLIDTFLFGRSDALRDGEPLLGNVIDSTGVMDLIMFLQERFAISIDDDEVTAENLDSLKSAVSFVQRKMLTKA
ncbi:MAG TPA: acyl carrier protein [Candidatus Sulfotelmatobacter sp.]|nr:acyl carrier protein [Candidatus Sulfotelmatobacter sp.]